MKDYYKILEVEKTVTLDEIKSQHRFLLHAWHPDKFPNVAQKAKAEDKVREINEAYAVLCDPIKRSNYDRTFYEFTGQTQQTSTPYSSTPPKEQSHPSKEQSREHCQSCGLPVDTGYVEFHENIGMVFMRNYRHIKGNFCKSCIDYYFWNLTGKTMLLGWWGVISFLVTPLILLNNLVRFIFTRGLKRPVLQVAPNPSPFWIFTTIGGYLFIGYFVINMLSPISTPTSYSSPATAIPTTAKATIVPSVKVNTPTSQSSNCLHWSKVTTSMIGRNVCVYGKVYDTKFVGESSFQVLFSNDPYDFFLAGGTYYYVLNPGECVLAEGKALESGVGAPYIDIDAELLFCEPWMEK